MRKLQQSKIVFENGKQKSKEKVGEEKKVIDSSAEHLTLEGKSTIANAKNSKGVAIVTVWEDLGAIEKSKKKETKKD